MDSADRAASPAWERRALDRSLSEARQRQVARAHALVGAAKGLASARGSADFTVSEVAERAGVSLRTFYRQFSTKEDLLVALFEEEARRGADLLAEAMNGVRSPLERLERYLVGLWTLMATGSGYASLLVREHLRLAEHRPRELREALGPLVGLLEDTLHDAAEAGEVRKIEPDEAVLVFSTVLAHVHTSILFGTEGDADRAGEGLWRFWKAALAPVHLPAGGSP